MMNQIFVGFFSFLCRREIEKVYKKKIENTEESPNEKKRNTLWARRVRLLNYSADLPQSFCMTFDHSNRTEMFIIVSLKNFIDPIGETFAS